MKPQHLTVEPVPAQSFSIRKDVVPHKNNLWHYHQELELIHFKKGDGIQFIGDSIQRFETGDVVLLGANLPHYWRFDSCYFGQPRKSTDVRVIHFREDFLGRTFLNLPENKNLKRLFEKSKTGLKFEGDTSEYIAKMLQKILESPPQTRLILLIKTLSRVASSSEVQYLSKREYSFTFEDRENGRINKIYNYALRHFQQKITLKEIAQQADLTENAFCRFFKSKTGKTFSQLLIEIRISHACKLLADTNLPVKAVCFDSGFNNFASFHKYFKKMNKKSPLAYRRSYQEQESESRKKDY